MALNWMATLKQAAQIRVAPASWLEDSTTLKSWPSSVSLSSHDDEFSTTMSSSISQSDTETLFALCPVTSSNSKDITTPQKARSLYLEAQKYKCASNSTSNPGSPVGSSNASPSVSSCDDQVPMQRSRTNGTPIRETKERRKKNPEAVNKKSVSTKRKLTHLVGNMDVKVSPKSTRAPLPNFTETLNELQSFLDHDLIANKMKSNVKLPVPSRKNLKSRTEEIITGHEVSRAELPGDSTVRCLQFESEQVSQCSAPSESQNDVFTRDTIRAKKNLFEWPEELNSQAEEIFTTCELTNSGREEISFEQMLNCDDFPCDNWLSEDVNGIIF